MIDNKLVNTKLAVVDRLVMNAMNSEDTTVAGVFLTEAHNELVELEMHVTDEELKTKVKFVYDEFLKLNEIILNSLLHTYSRNFEKMNLEYNKFNQFIVE